MDANGKIIDLSGVEETALLTLFARVSESRSADPILKDKKAEALADKLEETMRQDSGKRAMRKILRSPDPKLAVHISLRARKYDDCAMEFLSSHPEGAVVNIGCGMDTRFFRVDNGRCFFFDLDLPEMIRIKKQFIEENGRYSMIGQSVLETSWMERVAALRQPVIFLAEGLFMYLSEKDVKSLVLEMQQRFPESELVCELTNRAWVEGFWGKISQVKMQKRFKMSAGARFQFGVNDAREMESWHAGIEFLEKWFYMDSNHPKLGALRIFRNTALFSNAQYTTRYRLHAA